MPGMSYTIWPHGAQYPLHIDADRAVVHPSHFGERRITVERDNMIVAEVFNAVAWESRPLITPEDNPDTSGLAVKQEIPEGYNIPYSP